MNISLGLICQKEVRPKIIKKFGELDISFFQDADLYLVEKGMEKSYIPCIVFDGNDIEGLVQLMKLLIPSYAGNRLIGTLNEELCIIDYKDVLYIEANNAKVLCHTRSDIFLLHTTLYKLEKTLSRDDFIRISKSFIININNVAKIIPWFNRRLLLKFVDYNKEVEVSKNYVNKFKQFLGIR